MKFSRVYFIHRDMLENAWTRLSAIHFLKASSQNSQRWLEHLNKTNSGYKDLDLLCWTQLVEAWFKISTGASCWTSDLFPCYIITYLFQLNMFQLPLIPFQIISVKKEKQTSNVAKDKIEKRRIINGRYLLLNYFSQALIHPIPKWLSI